MTSSRDTYTLGYNSAEQERMGRRTTTHSASFLLRRLRPGMRVLDAGCGPGSITVGLAAAVALGGVVGLDRAERQLMVARERAVVAGVGNVRFVHGDVYALPFPDGAFDAVLAHALLKHLRDPLAALKEFHRVLALDGVVGIADLDWGALLWEPATPLLDEARELLLRVWIHNGASPFYARHQRRLLLEAGFSRNEAHMLATYPSHAGDRQATTRWAATLARWFQEPAFVETALGQGWVDEERLDALVTEIRNWGECPDAFFAVMPCAAIGWVDGDTGSRTS